PVLARVEDEMAQWPDRHRRDDAYARLTAAASAADDAGAVRAAEEFLALPQGRPTDPRCPQVARVLADAVEVPHRRPRTAAYAELRAARASGDDLPALLAAEKYLEAPPIQTDDARTATVRAWYAETFTSWMLTRTDPLDAEAQARVAKYRILAPTNQG